MAKPGCYLRMEAHVHLQRTAVQCGKNCKGCPHHAYWYGILRVGGRQRKVYFGKERPSAADVVAKLAEKNLPALSRWEAKQLEYQCDPQFNECPSLSRENEALSAPATSSA